MLPSIPGSLCTCLSIFEHDFWTFLSSRQTAIQAVYCTAEHSKYCTFWTFTAKTYKWHNVKDNDVWRAYLWVPQCCPHGKDSMGSHQCKGHSAAIAFIMEGSKCEACTQRGKITVQNSVYAGFNCLPIRINHLVQAFSLKATNIKHRDQRGIAWVQTMRTPASPWIANPQ